MKKLFFGIITLFTLSFGLLISDAYGQLPPCVPGGGCLYGGSVTTINTSAQRVEGEAISYLNYQAGIMYNPAVEAWLFRTDIPATDLDYRYNQGSSSELGAQVFLSTNNYVAGRTYCTYSRHYIVLRSNQQHTFGGDYQDCKTVPATPPTPPPTPFPTPTPCDPLGLNPCLPPTPTPTPTTTAQATISPFDVVEKYGTVDVTVTITNSTSVDTIVSFRTASGSGVATFADGVAVKAFSGNQNLTLKIKGVTESAQLDGIFLEVKNNNVLLASEPFTVAVITSLEFEKFDSTYADLDNNPGNGQPGTNVGRRIYPDKRPLTPADTIDRSLVKVKANVLPAVSNLKVYFGSFDLDDPSANAAPIDANLSEGKDNNGQVNSSKSGDFTLASSCTNGASGTAPNHISKIECTTASDGTVSAAFKTTMNPGDNFAIAASVSNLGTYRNGINVNAADGANLLNSSSQTIPISGGANPNSVAGIRTEMLTVWRKLHIEVDSMGSVSTGNNVTGTFTSNETLNPNALHFSVPVSVGLEEGRFFLGRIEFQTGVTTYSLQVRGNDTVSLRIRNDTPNSITIRRGTSFTLYDDDDFNSNDVDFDGDAGEPINPLPDIFPPDEAPFKTAYISFDTAWAAGMGFNSSNVTFDLNINTSSSNPGLVGLLNTNRNSTSRENSDFWVAYLIFGYQGGTSEDYDGYLNCVGTTCQSESPLFGFTLNMANAYCDCLNSVSCPTTNVCPSVPTGGIGSVILQEVVGDYRRSFMQNSTMNRTIVSHELGHQFGLRGDQMNSTTLQIMDYAPNTLPGPAERFHDEHIFLIRSRMQSPGN